MLSLSQELTDRIAMCDPAGGKEVVKRTLARSAIVVCGRDHLDRIFVLDAWAARVSTDKIIDQVFAMQERWNPLSFGIESSGQQSLFVDSVKRVSRLEGKRINVVSVPQPTRVDKTTRIRTALQVPLAEGRIFVQRKHIELMTELGEFPTGQTVDMVDALASCVTLFGPRTTQRENQQGVRDFYDFLREQGLTHEDAYARIEEEFGHKALAQL